MWKQQYKTMDKEPLISIITITFNAETCLRPTMESVASQSCEDYEHIIIDGASTDGTVSIAREYPGTRILSEKDKGLYDAMNKGLRMARGEYLLFLNAGDAFHKGDTLEQYARAARGGADIIYGDTVIVDSERRIIGQRHLSAPAELTKESFSQGMLICHQAFMVRRALAPDYDLQYRFSADYDWTVKCIEASEPQRNVNLNMITIDYLSDGMTDRNKLKSLRERYRIMAKHYGQLTTFTHHIGFIVRALRRRL